MTTSRDDRVKDGESTEKPGDAQVPVWGETGRLWLTPILFIVAWTALPLGLKTDFTMSRDQQLWIFSILYHPLYIVGSIAAGYQLFGVVLPVPPRAQQIGFGVFAAVLDTALLQLLYNIYPNYYRYTSATTVYIISVLFFAHVLIPVHAEMKSRKYARRGEDGKSFALGDNDGDSQADDGGKGKSDDLYYTDSYYSDYDYYSSEDGRDMKAATYRQHSWALSSRDNVALSLPEDDSDVEGGEGDTEDKRNLYYVYFKMVLFSACILISYYYCQAFSQIFFAYSNRGSNFGFQLGMIAGFGIPLFVIQNLMLFLTKGTDSPGGQGSNIPLGYFVVEMFYQTFYKHLFTEVRDLPPFIAIQALLLVQGIVLYPFRMSSFVHRFLYKLGNKGKETSEEHFLEDQHNYRRALAEEFYYVAMSQRVTVIVYLANAVMMRYTYNSPFYPFEEIPTSRYWRILRFTGYMFAFEWGASAIIHVLILFLFKMDTVQLGATQMIRGKSVWPCIIMAVHILSDANIMLNSFEFA